MDSGNLAVNFTLEAQGEGAEELQGPVKVTLEGPFDASDQESMPKFDLDASLRGRGPEPRRRAPPRPATRASSPSRARSTSSPTRSSSSSRRSTSRRAQQAESQQGQQPEPRDARHGPAQVARRPAETRRRGEGRRHGHGQDHGRHRHERQLLDDANKALEAAAALGATQGQEIPEKPHRGAAPPGHASAIKDPRIEIYTGKDDKILRRLVLSLGIDGPTPAAAARSPSTSRSPISTSRRTSPSRRTRSRSTSCSASSAGSAPSARGCRLRLGLGQRQRRLGRRRAPDGDFEAYSKCLEEGRRRRREGARLRRPPRAVTRPVSSHRLSLGSGAQ